METKVIFGFRTLVAIFGLASIITLATGFLPLTDSPTPGGEWQPFGLPIPWKEYERGCPPPCLQTGTNYAWPFFALDVVIYAVVGYGLIHVLSKKPGREFLLAKRLESGRLLLLLFVTAIILFMGNLAYDSFFWMGTNTSSRLMIREAQGS